MEEYHSTSKVYIPGSNAAVILSNVAVIVGNVISLFADWKTSVGQVGNHYAEHRQSQCDRETYLSSLEIVGHMQQMQRAVTRCG